MTTATMENNVGGVVPGKWKGGTVTTGMSRAIDGAATPGATIGTVGKLLAKSAGTKGSFLTVVVVGIPEHGTEINDR
ncbi:hypothetical protein sscle_10g076750 [Sclerotinia sclerotiorum 1980 UF-70]|uniref:Uncharacterized protein n=1 Tax=Sclerotinia sclerotiorum (strain ATCC 18683 / 1980 / Ss-1) TaxID=665079 RepID=A0A1D9QD75_SCLS1|nr:hypothetical protein sscle_10g076750 [Sclerotinia sclerotiorum 1980 UF-70]